MWWVFLRARRKPLKSKPVSFQISSSQREASDCRLSFLPRHLPLLKLQTICQSEKIAAWIQRTIPSKNVKRVFKLTSCERAAAGCPWPLTDMCCMYQRSHCCVAASRVFKNPVESSSSVTAKARKHLLTRALGESYVWLRLRWRMVVELASLMGGIDVLCTYSSLRSRERRRVMPLMDTNRLTQI